MAPTTQVRQNFSEEAENAINQQINTLWYVYRLISKETVEEKIIER